MKVDPYSDQPDPRLKAIGEKLDDRDSEDPDFVVDENLSSVNTGYGGVDPAKESDPRNDTFDPES